MMIKMSRLAAPVAAVFTLAVASQPAFAHAVAGDRVFPVTLTMDDPGVADEVTLPQIVDQPGSGPSNQTQLQWEWDKTITPSTALIYNHGFDILTATGTKRATGFENPVITGKWQVYVNAEHEFIASLGIQRELPPDLHTISIGGDQHGSTSPTVYFGKGLGDLPIGALRPLAITGEAIYTIPDVPVNTAGTNGGSMRAFSGHLSLQYSMPYLQSQVKDHGLPDFFNRLIPLVEAAYVTPTAAPSGGTPMAISYGAGAIYMADTYQVGMELLIPGNRAAGLNVGYVVQVHFFLDDILPNSLGRPIFR
jgi:hypothetical protein